MKINLPVTGRNVDVALDEGRQSQRNSEDVAGLAGDLRLLAREFWGAAGSGLRLFWLTSSRAGSLPQLKCDPLWERACSRKGHQPLCIIWIKPPAAK